MQRTLRSPLSSSDKKKKTSRSIRLFRDNCFRTSILLYQSVLLSFSSPNLESHASPDPSIPSKSSARLGKISDKDWKKIAGSKLNESYTVVQGDTLAEISKKLFGKPKYWKKIWALNGSKITHPNRLKPGVLLTFNSTGNDLDSISPSLTDANSTSLIPSQNSAEFKKKKEKKKEKNSGKQRSKEWELLPTQSWEKSQVRLSSKIEIDPTGIDHKNIIQRNRSRGFDSNFMVSSEKIPFVGKIAAGPESENFTPTDTIFIHGENDIQTGETYAVTTQPALIKSMWSDRAGYVYNILGRIQVLGVREGIHIGTVLTGQGMITRGQFLIPNPPRVPELKTEPGPSPLKGHVFFNPFNLSTLITQHSEVIIDLGSKDGIAPGMYFRTFEHEDRYTHKRLTRSDFIVQADLQVTQVSENFSQALVMHTNFPVKESSPAVLVTHLSTLLKHAYQAKPMNPDETEDLDSLETPDTLAPAEEAELKELENIKDLPDPLSLESPLPDPSSSPSPSSSPWPSPLQSPESALLPSPSPSPSPSPVQSPALNSTDSKETPKPDTSAAPADNSLNKVELPTNHISTDTVELKTPSAPPTSESGTLAPESTDLSEPNTLPTLD